MSANLSPNLEMNFADTAAIDPFLIALIGPDEEKRSAVAAALDKWPGADVRQFPSYPPSLDDLTGLQNLAFDAIVIDADSDTDYAVKIMESLSERNSSTIMAYSWSAKQDLSERFRRAGAREYLDAPFEFSVPSALERAADARHAKNNPSRSWEAKQLVFLGAKGGSGTTTLACSFATVLAQETRQRTLLIDLGLPLGDAALNLGLTSEYSTEDVFKNPSQMDPSLLEALVVRHESGLDVLAAPSKVPDVAPTSETIDKLMKIARKVFTNVIVDVGSRLDLMETCLFSDAYRIYLVSQAGISDLRNAERLMSRYFEGERQRLEIVINRFEPGTARVTDDQMTSALGRQVRWKVPASSDAILLTQSEHLPMSNPDSPFSQAVLEMAGSITLHPVRANRSNAGTSAASAAQSEDSSGATKKHAGTARKEEAIYSGTPSAIRLPEVYWPSPEAITFGMPLNESHLNATASAPGSFVYTPGAGYVLPVGTHTLWVTFTSAEGQMVQSAVSITVAKATPTVTWPVPRPIPCDTPLSEVQLNATASVPGRFEYAPEIGNVLTAGEHALAVVFTPADDKSYTATKAAVSISVEKLKPAIDWPLPEKIGCGAKLSQKQLNAKASVAGTFVYSPEAGEILEPGQHVLTAHFAPADSSRYSPAQSTVTVTVMKAPPRINWATPEPIVYGAPLSTAQLNAISSEEGTFEYFPSIGAVLAVGEHTPSVTFTPRNNADYPAIQAAVPLSVVMARPVISWNPPATIPTGTALSEMELNAKASVAGSFQYKPALSEILPVGKHTLTAIFTPTDSMNCEPVRATASITVTELETVQIDWPAPAGIPYGTPLSAAQLNATASIPGTFAYGPCEGNVLPPGNHTLLAVFTPDDPRSYAVANATVTLQVDPLPDVASLLSVHTQAPIGREVADQSISEINERELIARDRSASAQLEFLVPEPAPHKDQELVLEHVAANGAVAAQASAPPPVPRETRTYKGVIYEKGDDGQWHRVQR